MEGKKASSARIANGMKHDKVRRKTKRRWRPHQTEGDVVPVENSATAASTFVAFEDARAAT
eukprot:5068927-Pleurochrysis_carterae.AAC.1